MRNRGVTTVLTYGILALAGVVSFVMPDKLAGSPETGAARSPRSRFIAPAVSSQMRAKQDQDGVERAIMGPERPQNQRH